MFKKIQERIFPFIIALSALSVSASAAFYSVSGLSKLFAGAALAVIIMAGSLEIAKLVIASLLYQYRKTLPKLLKIYLSIACVVLIGITSMGIYGFLSSAYQETAGKDKLVTQQVEALQTKKKLYEDSRSNILQEKQSIAQLKGTLSQLSTTQYTDKNGNLVVRSNKANVTQLNSANASDDKLTSKLDVVNDSIFSLENQILEVQTNGDAASELGPLKYLSELTGVGMNKIINWLLLVIIFVFDPLAIALVIAANFAFSQLKKKEYPLEEQVEDMRKVVDTYDDLNELISQEETNHPEYDEFEEWDSTLDDGLEDEEFENWYIEQPITDIYNKQTNPENNMKFINYLKEKFFTSNEEIKQLDLPMDDQFVDEVMEDVIPETIEEITPEVIETPSEPISAPKMDVNMDGVIDNEDLRKINEFLSNPDLPTHKREYWEALKAQLLKKLADDSNTITYN